MEKIIKMYTKELKSTCEIGRLINRSAGFVWSILKKNNIRIRSISKARLLRKQKLGYLNSPLTRRKLKKFRKGKILSKKTKQKIGIANLGEKNGQWKGGKKIHKGYILIYAPNHPANINNYISEHQLVMEKYLGRYLLLSETIHHIDGNRSNNDITNLHLFFNQSKHMIYHKFLERCVKTVLFWQKISLNPEAALEDFFNKKNG